MRKSVIFSFLRMYLCITVYLELSFLTKKLIAGLRKKMSRSIWNTLTYQIARQLSKMIRVMSDWSQRAKEAI
jgi:hypothetical protein